MTYKSVHDTCAMQGHVVDFNRITAFTVLREKTGEGPWKRTGAYVPVGKGGWVFVGRG